MKKKLQESSKNRNLIARNHNKEMDTFTIMNDY